MTQEHKLCGSFLHHLCSKRQGNFCALPGKKRGILITLCPRFIPSIWLCSRAAVKTERCFPLQQKEHFSGGREKGESFMHLLRRGEKSEECAVGINGSRTTKTWGIFPFFRNGRTRTLNSVSILRKNLFFLGKGFFIK